MKRAMVVYESLFGDGRLIARAVADGLAASMPAEAVPVGQAGTTVDSEVGLLVVGGPNHQLGMPRPASRQQAVDRNDADVDPASPGLREWLEALRPGGEGVAAVAYDTRLEHPRLLKHLDHAAHTEEKLLRRRGCDILAPAEHFYVASATGPLVTGEEDRARAWGRALGELVLARSERTPER